ncbi:Predicted membrane protein [Actinopolyspora lacussalsi subsp. righensis]|uniref:Predicted membrane protein n=1 Tax=Actinopolyspora righensis TaxID=995060 RepID=A0A1I6XE67_9ACTN|nr:Predicted membrane protein [Actinopolyspora righensis]
MLVVFNLLHALPRYLSFDPALSRTAIDPNFALHYPVLVLHVVTGNLAMVTVFLQILPWLRKRSVRLHRWSGLVYVYGGALPSSLLALILLPYSLAPTGKFGLFSMAIAWIATTIAGYRAQAGHRYRDHRKWMAYSFAISLGTSWGRILSTAMQTIPWFKIETMLFIEMSNWLWVGNVLLAHWWLQRRSRVNRTREALQPDS